MLPLPFGKGVIAWAEPVRIDADADKAALETARATLEARLIAANHGSRPRLSRSGSTPTPTRRRWKPPAPRWKRA